MITEGQHRPVDVGVPLVENLAPIPAPQDLPDGAVLPTVECGDALVSVAESGIRCLDSYAGAGWPGTSAETRLRGSVVSRLRSAEALLPDGFTLAIFDGLRSLETQRALYDRFYGPGSTLPPGYVADPDDRDVPPPHSTGAAVDLTLAWHDQALALGTWFDEFTPLAAVDALEGDPDHELDASLRRLLHWVLRAVGFAGLSSEWWHVSYGDQQWAHQYQQPRAIYGPAHQLG